MNASTFCHWCGSSLVGKRSHARFCDSSCRASATRWKQGRSSDDEKALGSAATPPIQVIREGQEAEVERWSTVVDEAIARHFREHPGETFHADDIEHLGVPDEYRRSVVGSQIAKWANRRWMVECGRRKSAIPSRNGAKSNEYRLTELGRKRIVGLGAGARLKPEPSAESGENRSGGTSGVPVPQGPGGSVLARSAPDTQPGRAPGRDGDRAPGASPASVAEELTETEGRLFEPVPLSSSSAFSPENDWA